MQDSIFVKLFIAILMLLALGAVFSCTGTTDDEDDGASDSDTDSDGDDDWDDEGGDEDCDDAEAECDFFCSVGGVVSSEDVGSPAIVDAICTAAGSPVVSTLAAVLHLDASEMNQAIATGLVEIPDDIRSRMVGLPEIAFGTGSDEWTTFEITALEEGEGGFSFQVAWPLVSSTLDCDLGDATATIVGRVRFSMQCDAADEVGADDAGVADGGVFNDAALADKAAVEVVGVEAVTNLAWCYSDDFVPTWYSSGELCPHTCDWEWYVDCPA